jgi:hypothetical protein
VFWAAISIHDYQILYLKYVLYFLNRKMKGYRKMKIKPHKKLTWFIDMDGVFVDFLGGAIDWFGCEKTIEDDWPQGEWGDEKVFIEFFGKTFDQFWPGVQDEKFWAGLDFTYDGKAFLKFMRPLKPVILTSPSFGGATGKQMWIKKHAPKYLYSGRYLIGPGKNYVAREGAVLIDDYEKNIDEWKAAGGIGILYPRPWNHLYFIPDPLKWVTELVKSILDMASEYTGGVR